MTSSTTSPVQAQAQTTNHDTLLATVPWYGSCTAEQQSAVQADHAMSGMAALEHAVALAEFQSYAEFTSTLPTPPALAAAAAVAAAVEDDTALEQQAAEQGTVLESATQQAEQDTVALDAEQQAAEQAADLVLKTAATVYRKGEKSYAWHLLRTGQLAHEYAISRMAIATQYTNGTAKGARTAALDCVTLELQKCSSGKVEVARMVQSYHAYVLLSGEPLPDKHTAKVVVAPFGHYRDCWANLVQRTAATKDTPQEQWELLPGMEDRCREAYAALVGSSKDEVAETVNAISREWTTQQAAKAKADAEVKAQAEREAREQATKERAELGQQAKAAAELEAKAKAEQDAEKKALLTAQSEQAKADLVAQQQADQAASARVEHAAQERARSEQNAESLAAKEQAVKAKAESRSQRKAKTTSQAPTSMQKATPIKDQATDATPEQWADMLAETLDEHPQAEDVLFAQLAKVLAQGRLSRKGKTAVETALHIWHRKPEQKPVTVVPLAKAS
jgi:hypothetical protein